MNLKTLLVASLAGAAAAADAPAGVSDVSSVTCGNTQYEQTQIERAVAEGCDLYDQNKQIGRSNYPHRFNNREDLTFNERGPYQEFPIVSSGTYSGRSPGADRIVFNPNLDGECTYVGTMTHTGAETRNGFVMCDEEVSRDNSTNNSTSTDDDDDDSAGSALSPAWLVAASGAAAWVALGL